MVPFVDSLSFDRNIQVIQNQTKFNSSKILDKHKMVLKKKAHMVIPLYQMISLSVVHPTFKIDTLKMEQTFQTGYQKRDKVFYVSFFNWKGRRNAKKSASLLGVDIGFENERFESFLLANLDLKLFSRCMLFVWDGNHRLQAWLPYINYLQDDEPPWHIHQQKSAKM